MTSRRRRLALLLVTALAAAAAAGCTGGDGGEPAAGGQELRVGLLTPLKGPNGAVGVEAQRGAQLAADVINGINPSVPLPLAANAGLANLGDAKVRIITRDAFGPEAQVVAGTAVTELVSKQRADALIGAYDPQVTEYASQRSERFEVPFMNADSPATFLTEAGRDWFFRLGPSWRTTGESFYSLLREQALTPRGIVVLHVDDKAGQDVYSTAKDLAQQSGQTGEVSEVKFAPTATDLIGKVAEVRAKNPDTIFIYATPATVRPLVIAFGALKYRTKATMSFGTGYLAPDAFKDALPVVSQLTRSVSWSLEAADRNPAARAVAGLYERRYSTQMTEAAASSFTAVMTIAQAVDAARSTDPQRIRTALLSLDVPGEQTIMPWSGIRFDETHQNVKAQNLVEQLIGRTFQVVYPRDAAGQAFQWPATATAPAA